MEVLCEWDSHCALESSAAARSVLTLGLSTELFLLLDSSVCRIQNFSPWDGAQETCLINDRTNLSVSPAPLLIPEAASAEPSMTFVPPVQSLKVQGQLCLAVQRSMLGLGAWRFWAWLEEMGACQQSSRTTWIMAESSGHSKEPAKP